MNIKINLYRSQICMAAALLIAGVLTAFIIQSERVEAKLLKTQQSLAKEVLRFHVLANSDSEADQALKMEVKAGVLKYMKAELPHSKSAEETKAWAMSHEDELTKVAKQIIDEAGYQYPVKVAVTNCYFPDKTYGDITFPAGDYEALRIEIGAAKGRNWWCVLYPNLCFVDATHAVVPNEGKEELKEVLAEEEYEMVTATSEFKIKWFFFSDDKED